MCILIYAQPLSQTGRQRLKVIFEHSDGFEIAREDLHLRGPGEFVGARQSGALAALRRPRAGRGAGRACPQAGRAPQASAPQRADLLLERWFAGREGLLRA